MKTIVSALVGIGLLCGSGTAMADFTRTYSTIFTVNRVTTQALSLFCRDVTVYEGGTREVRGTLISGSAIWIPIPGTALKRNITGVRFLEKGQIGPSTYRITIENRADDITNDLYYDYVNIQVPMTIECLYKDSTTTLQSRDAIDEELDRAMEEEEE